MNMKFMLLLYSVISVVLTCRPQGHWHDPEAENKRDTNFSPGDTWGGWEPPPGQADWKKWIESWGKYVNKYPETGEEWVPSRDTGTGLPYQWKGIGKGIAGIPPPPWAYIAESYDKPQYCFQQPKYGDCSKQLQRWGFDPTKSQCQTFVYSGCRGNGNNFLSEAACIAACVGAATTNCEDEPGVNLEEMIITDFKAM